MGGLVLVCSIISIVLSARWSSLRWSSRLLLLFGGPIDGVLGCALLSWFGLSSANAVAGGLLLGLLSMMFLQPMLVSQRLLVWRLARENIRRRRRQSALMLAGLIIASAIITSSLVVGDSLDETVSQEVSAAWGETDILVSGLDPQTGTAVEFNESIGNRLWSALQDDDEFEDAFLGRQFGVAASVSLSAINGLAEPSVSLYALDADVDAAGIWAPLNPENGYRFTDLRSALSVNESVAVAINQVAAEMLEVSEGDTLSMGAFVTRDGARERVSQDVYVHAVVPNEGQGAMAGSMSPAVFASLDDAQSILEMEGQLTRISLAYDDARPEEELRAAREAVEVHMDGLLTGEDAGLVFTADDSTASLSISSNTGLQRLSGEDVRGLRENASQLYPNASLLEVLQVPLIDVMVEGESLLTLADKDVNRLYTTDSALWHITSNGVGFEPVEGEAWLWQVEEGDVVEDTARNETGQAMLVATKRGVTLVDEGLDDEEPRAHYDSENAVVAVSNSSNGWLALVNTDLALNLLQFDQGLELQSTAELDVTVPSTVLDHRVFVDDGIVHLSIEGLLSTDFYQAPLNNLEFVQTNGSSWTDEPVGGVSELHDACDGTSAVQTSLHRAWCTTAEGLLRWNLSTGEVVSIRLPVLSDAPGFGRFPQMVLAFGGENAAMMVENGTMMTSQRMGLLGLENDSSDVGLTGLLPYVYGNDSMVMLASSGLYTALPGFEQLRDLDGVVLGLVSLSDAERLALAGEDDRS
ncbi:MAG: hypothetical protein QF531_03365, partial [Candidatus Poseidonia sp.]|nr:hypothetical protein [Poseidonia sp.]